MSRKVPTPGWAVLLFLIASVLNTVVNGFLFATWPDLGILLGELLAILLPTLIVVSLLRCDAPTTLRLRLPSRTDFLLALPLAVSLAVLNDQLSNLTGQIFPIHEELREAIVQLLRADTGYEWTIRLLGLAVGAAVAEELLFRGFIQTSLERSVLGRTGAILLTSFLFAVMHFIPQGLPSFALAGVVLGITAIATGSILIPIVIHCVNNASAIALLNLADLETLGQPVWIPPGILIPALLIFALTLGYFLRRAAEHPAPELPSAEPLPRPGTVMPSIPPADPDVPRRHRKLGWFAVGCAVFVGTLVVLGLFSLSLFYMPQARSHQIRAMKDMLLDAVPTQNARLDRDINEAFDALEELNRSGRLTIYQFLRLWWLVHVGAQVDGIITEQDIEAVLVEVRLILHSGARVRRL
jgi:membrane protease YdiL (CAAX protease family)